MYLESHIGVILEAPGSSMKTNNKAQEKKIQEKNKRTSKDI